MARPSWVNEILETYSNGEIQAGADFTRYVRQRRTKDAPGEQKTRVVEDTRRCKGTGIPASTIQKLRDNPAARISKTTLSKLKNYDRRTKYNTLKSAGVSTDLAKQISAQNLTKHPVRISKEESISNVSALADYYKEIAKIISVQKNVPVETIIYGLTHSTEDADYWEEYVRVGCDRSAMEDDEDEFEGEGEEDSDWDE